MEGLLIRPADPHEAEVLLAIQKASALAGFEHIFPPELYPFPDAAVLERWHDALVDEQAEIAVAEAEGRAAGLACTRPDWLEGLYVMPELWGSGVGARLHDYAVTRLRERGSARGHLRVLEENHRARRFYERRGWRLNGTSRQIEFPPHPFDIGYSLDLGPP